MPNNIGFATEDEVFVKIEANAKKGIRSTVEDKHQLVVTNTTPRYDGGKQATINPGAISSGRDKQGLK